MSNNKSNAKSSNKGSEKTRGNKPPYRQYTKGKTQSDKQRRREEEMADTGASMSRGNPIEFYTVYDKFAHDAANIPFARVLGNTYETEVVNYDAAGQVYKFKTADPGLMRIVFTPSIGVSHDYTSPVNRSSTNYYGRLRSTQKSFGNYDHQDLTMMILAIDSLVMFHALGRKIYGVLTDMTPINRYYPRAIVGACGVSFPDTQKQIQDFRAWLNELALRIEQYTLPDNIRLIKRHAWMCEGLYTDSPASRAQTYMFVPAGFWKYNNTATTGGQLDWVQYIVPGETAATQLTIEQFEAIGNDLINAISNDEDFATISGDLYTYYGGQSMKLPYVDEGYRILPKYDETVLSQIENATICGFFSPNYTPVIKQTTGVNEGAIIFEPEVQLQNYSFEMASMAMNFHKDSPSSDDVIEASRLMSVFAEESDSNFSVALASTGSEFVNCLDIFVTNPATMGVRSRRLMQSVYRYLGAGTAASTPAWIQNAMSDMVWLAKFDWAPAIHFFSSLEGELEDTVYVGNTWDVDNSTLIRREYIDTINTACLYSLFSVATK